MLNSYYTNANSLANKMIELTHMMHDNDIDVDVVGIAETWAKDEMSDAEFEIEGYQLY
jgi:hypothetical protein